MVQEVFLRTNTNIQKCWSELPSVSSSLTRKNTLLSAFVTLNKRWILLTSFSNCFINFMQSLMLQYSMFPAEAGVINRISYNYRAFTLHCISSSFLECWLFLNWHNWITIPDCFFFFVGGGGGFLFFGFFLIKKELGLWNSMCSSLKEEKMLHVLGVWNKSEKHWY